ncbi:deoxyhypusine synthase [Candidatus Poribacteria bacterium]|nr:deoxyhypusine synthase [Candidatus Poribacteria bacterium]
MKKHLKIPTQPVEIEKYVSVPELLGKMGGASFQGRNLSITYEVWKRMLSDQTTIFMGLAGALVPAGMRKIIAHTIENRWIDCLVSTGANLFHDIHETLGKYHWKGSHQVDDCELKEEGIDRIYDTFAVEDEFRETDEYIGNFAATLDQNRPYTTREFLYLLGEKLSKECSESGIVSSAYEAGVPIYCPAIGDSSIGIGVACGRYKGENSLIFDVMTDVLETAQIVIESDNTGVIYLGGGTPKNFIQQTEVTASIMGFDVEGHKYAAQIITDPPHWGGLSGCTFAEAQSWGKIAFDATSATVYCDATIGLPVITSALEAEKDEFTPRKSIPEFIMGRELKISITL